MNVPRGPSTMTDRPPSVAHHPTATREASICTLSPSAAPALAASGLTAPGGTVTPSAAEEFDEFVRGRTPALLRTAYLLTGDQHLAEDLVQSALARCHRAWHRLDATGNAEAYTRRIMYHLQVSWWRRRRVRESVTDAVPDRAPHPSTTGEITARITLHQALLRLSGKQRAVLVLRFFEDRSEAETADVLGVSVGTVKSQTSRALDRLRTIAPELSALRGNER